ncbi:MAG: hypothetical protein ACLS8R_10635 [Anaeromassilibacillus sp.]
MEQGCKVEVALDLMPEYTESQILHCFTRPSSVSPRSRAAICWGNVEPERRAGLARCAHSSQNSRTVFETLGTVSRAVKNFRFPVVGLLSWTAHRCDRRCRFRRSIAGRWNRNAGAFITGELLNADGIAAVCSTGRGAREWPPDAVRAPY